MGKCLVCSRDSINSPSLILLWIHGLHGGWWTTGCGGLAHALHFTPTVSRKGGMRGSGSSLEPLDLCMLFLLIHDKMKVEKSARTFWVGKDLSIWCKIKVFNRRGGRGLEQVKWHPKGEAENIALPWLPNQCSSSTYCSKNWWQLRDLGDLAHTSWTNVPLGWMT